MLDRALLFDFDVAGRRLRLWKRLGESYEHVLMKALGYAMFVEEFPGLEIERGVGLRYKPDLVARAADGRLHFWGECGANSIRKTAWVLKHSGVGRFVLFKMGRNISQLAAALREDIPERYRPAGRVTLVNFMGDVAARTLDRRINSVPESWYAREEI